MGVTIKKPIRVLHVLGGMNRGGAETWLMHVLRNMDQQRFRFDFLVHTESPCAYDEEIRAIGSQIIPCLKPTQPWRYAKNFLNIIRKYGPYDVIHSHVHHYSGFVLWLARMAGVSKRIAHSHNDSSVNDNKATKLRKAYLSLTEHLLRKNASFGLACSIEASKALFGTQWETDQRWRILYCGVDLTIFSKKIDSIAVRKEFAIPETAFVIGHVGRFSEEKNHSFLLDIAACLSRKKPEIIILLVGDGPLRQVVETKVNRLGLKDKVIFTGVRPDVPRMMLGAMDVFLLPSLHEGLPLVLMEAQAAGLPCVFSEVVSKETDVVPSLVHRISLNESAEIWADKVLGVTESEPKSKEEALRNVMQSSFNVSASIEQLSKIYMAQ